MRRGNAQVSAVLWRWLAFSFPTARSCGGGQGLSISHRARTERTFSGTGGYDHTRGISGRHRVAIIQSLLAGIGFKLAGIPAAGLLAFAVMLLAIVQIGAAIVLFPVIIWIWIDKDFTTALLLTLFLVVVGILDNVLKPLIMGRGLTTPTLVISLE
jgi:predicted PurR-regulated permease PerM